MKKKTPLIALVLSFAVLLGGASILYTRLSESVTPDQLAAQPPASSAADTGSSQDTSEQEEPQLPAPDFTVFDANGLEVRLSDYKGKPTVVNFWASWCGPCQMEMPDFHEKYLELGNDINFLMVNMTDGSRETVSVASEFIAKNGYSFPVLYDTSANAAMTYGVYSLPTTYFINAEGYAIAQATGAIDASTLQRGIDMIL